jgi:putative ABC transport system permease protein
LTVGDKFSIGELSVNVAGIFTADDPAEETYVYSHLEFLQRRKSADQVGTVTQLEVLLDPDADQQYLSTQIDDLFRGGPVQTDTRPKGVFQVQSLGDLTQLIGMAHWLGLACVGLVLMLVATTTVMSVQDRIQEHAVLQTLGFTGAKVFLLVLAESVLLGTAGGLIGVGAAMAVLQVSHLSLGAEAVAIAFTPSLRLAATGMAVAVVAGALAGVLPALHAARTEIVSALREA